MGLSSNNWDKWNRMLSAAKQGSTEWYEIAGMMENHHVRASIVNRAPYNEIQLLEVAERALRSAQGALGKNHPRAAEATQNLGFYYVAIKKDPDTAIDYFQLARETAGEYNPVLVPTYVRLGIYWYEEWEVTKAEEVLREALTIQRIDPNGDPEDLAEILFLLSYATAVTTGNEAALRFGQEAYEVLKAKAPQSKLLTEIEEHNNHLRQQIRRGL